MSNEEPPAPPKRLTLWIFGFFSLTPMLVPVVAVVNLIVEAASGTPALPVAVILLPLVWKFLLAPVYAFQVWARRSMPTNQKVLWTMGLFLTPINIGVIAAYWYVYYLTPYRDAMADNQGMDGA